MLRALLHALALFPCAGYVPPSLRSGRGLAMLVERLKATPPGISQALFATIIAGAARVGLQPHVERRYYQLGA